MKLVERTEESLGERSVKNSDLISDALKIQEARVSQEVSPELFGGPSLAKKPFQIIF